MTVIERTQEAQLTLTCDWTFTFDKPKEIAQIIPNKYFCMSDLHGVSEAEVLVLCLWPMVESAGQWTEYGYAIARGIPVIVHMCGDFDSVDADAWLDSKIFLAHDLVEYFAKSLSGLLINLVKLSKKKEETAGKSDE